MPQRDQIQSAGDYDLGQVAILGSSGHIVNITTQIKELNIYQSIDSPFMTGNIIIDDAKGVSSILPLIGQERLLFTFKTPSSYPIDFDTYNAVIYSIDKRFQTTNRSQVFIMSFTTLENYRNTRTKVSKSFKASPSEIVQELLTSEDYLSTKKPLFIDDTIGIMNYVAPNIRPYQVINTVMKNEAMTKENEPHFVFFENQRGIHFRSLDSMLGQGGELSMPHSRQYKFQPTNDRMDIDDSLSTIISWEIEDSSNTFLNGRAGMFSSTLTCHDIYNKNAEKFVYDYIEDMFKLRNSANQEYKNYGPMISESPVDGKKTLTQFPASRQFLHPKSQISNRAEMWMQESHSRRLEREFFTIKLEIFGDTNVMCGDLIDIVIPSNRELTAGDVDTYPDPILSGRYLITKLAHQINHPSQEHSMVLTAMKDSVKSSLITDREIQYPNEKVGKRDIGLVEEKRLLQQKTR